MRIRIEISTDNGADVTIERSRYEHTQLGGVEVDLKALDALLTTATSEARLAYGIDAAVAAAKGEAYQGATADRAAAHRSSAANCVIGQSAGAPIISGNVCNICATATTEEGK